MSYMPEFAPDARSEWRALDPEFQEVTLDIVEMIVAAPPAEHFGRESRAVEAHGARHVITVRVAVDHQRKLVTVIGVAHDLGATLS